MFPRPMKPTCCVEGMSEEGGGEGGGEGGDIHVCGVRVSCLQLILQAIKNWK